MRCDGLDVSGITLQQDDFRLTADLRIPKGARVGVIGPSGGGKSTLLSAIAGFLAPQQGRILWQGEDITALDPAQRPGAIIFQDNNLFPHLSAFDNMALGVKPSLRLSAAERARVEQALARVGLEGLGQRKPAQLSGGQQGRVALARVLCQAKPLILLDEPFAALGPALRAEMLGLVAELCAETGATLLMVTHHISDARAICDQVVLVADGAATGPFATGPLLDNPPSALRAYIGDVRT